MNFTMKSIPQKSEIVERTNLPTFPHPFPPHMKNHKGEKIAKTRHLRMLADMECKGLTDIMRVY